MPTEKTIHSWIGIFNDFLIIPMLTFIILDITDPTPHPHQDFLNLFLTISFFLEWIWGLRLTENRKNYLLSIEKNLDLISCLPVGTLTKSIRLVRLFKVVKLFRIVGRAKRYQGPGESIFRLLSLLGVTIFTGGYSILVVEPNHPQIHNFGDALWWSMITVSTVGYGDIVPTTPVGRVVAAALIATGLGVCGYIAGFASKWLQDEPTQTNDLQNLQDRMYVLEQKIDQLLLHQREEQGRTEEKPLRQETSLHKDDISDLQQTIKDPKHHDM